MWLPEINVFRLVCDPVNVMELVPLPLTVTPPPEVPVKLPVAADNESVMELVPASGSATLIPVTAVAVTGATFCEAEAVSVGFSFTLLRLTVSSLS